MVCACKVSSYHLLPKSLSYFPCFTALFHIFLWLPQDKKKTNWSTLKPKIHTLGMQNKEKQNLNQINLENHEKNNAGRPIMSGPISVNGEKMEKRYMDMRPI